MTFRNNLIYATLTLFLIFGITACSDDNSTGPNNNNGSEATINGSVEDQFSKSSPDAAAKDLEGTVVTAAKVTSSGSLEMMEETETNVNASGEFSLNVDASTAEEIVVVAENEGSRLKGFISAEIENGSSYNLKPINVESSAETDVFAEIKANGNADIVHKSDIESVITANGAADVQGNSSAIAEVAAGISNSAEARAEYFAEFTGDAQANMNTYFETMTEAQFDLESTLSTSSTSEQKAAFEAYLDATVDAYSEAGLEAKQVAEFMHMRGKVILNSMGSVSSDVESDARGASSYMIAVATDNAVQARAEASGMSGATISAIADAGSTLRSEVRSSGGAEASITAAFDTYHDEVRGAIENDSSVTGTAVVTIDTEINAASGAEVIFNSEISGTVDASQLIDAYVEFNNSVQSIVEANSALIGDIDVQVLSDIMVLINISS